MAKLIVVVDMQKDFIDGALGSAEAVKIVDRCAEKIEKARDAGDIIVFTRDTHGDDYMQTEEGKNLPVPHCIKGSEGWEI
nr:isochorismatase family protein [Lachnospiraceae bacterium]